MDPAAGVQEAFMDVEIFSNTAGRWLPGKAVHLQSPIGQVLVHFELDGSQMRKRVPFPSPFCRKAAAPAPDRCWRDSGGSCMQTVAKGEAGATAHTSAGSAPSVGGPPSLAAAEVAEGKAPVASAADAATGSAPCTCGPPSPAAVEVAEGEPCTAAAVDAAAGSPAAKVRTGKYTEAWSLIEAVEAGGTKLLSARWLVEFNRTRHKDEPIKRQQDLPSNAFINPADLRAKGINSNWYEEPDEGTYAILAVSYCWLTPQHPDPKGQQIETLARVFSIMLADCEYVDIAVFLDFSSLPQEPRGTPEEHAAFKSGLKDVNLWYAHRLTWVFMLTTFPAGWPAVKAYSERGWPSFERRISTLVKESLMCLDLGCLQDAGEDFSHFMETCKQSRCAPQGPDAFAEAVGRLHFTNGSDTEFVKAKYRQTAEEVLAEVGYLNFSRLGWGEGEVAGLVQVLPMAPCLKTLDLCYDNIGDQGSSLLAGALPACPSLQILILDGNSIGDDGAIALAGALPECLSLQTLKLSSNKFGTEGASALAGALPACPCLQDLDLSCNTIGDEGASALAGVLPTCPSLKFLDLRGDKIGAEGASALAGAMPACSSLQSLRVSMNEIGDAGASALAGALPACPSLQLLDLRGNNIGAEGASALAGALPACPYFQEFLLSSNRIGDEGATALAGALPGCRSLKTLQLAGNHIGDEGATAVAGALPGCLSLKELWLSWNNISDSGCKALRRAARRTSRRRGIKLYLDHQAQDERG